MFNRHTHLTSPTSYPTGDVSTRKEKMRKKGGAVLREEKRGGGGGGGGGGPGEETDLGGFFSASCEAKLRGQTRTWRTRIHHRCTQPFLTSSLHQTLSTVLLTLPLLFGCPCSAIPHSCTSENVEVNYSHLYRSASRLNTSMCSYSPGLQYDLYVTNMTWSCVSLSMSQSSPQVLSRTA